MIFIAHSPVCYVFILHHGEQKNIERKLTEN